MAAAEYYSTRPGENSSKPAAGKSTEPPIFPPTHGGGGYNDDLSYANTHYSANSIDEGTYPSPYSGPYSNDPEGKAFDLGGGPYKENIQLQDTSYPPAGAAAGGSGPPHRIPSQRRRPPKKVPWTRRYPWFCYLITIVQIGVFCGQLAKSASITGSPIAKKPFNYMIGPPADILINMGARFVPCMKRVPGVNDIPNMDIFGEHYLCKDKDPWRMIDYQGSRVNITKCSLKELCGFGGHHIPDVVTEKNQPDQWWRFIVPLFMHAGVLHLLVNMIIQVLLGGEIERKIGMLRFSLIYFLSGIFGFVLGGTVGGNAQASVGASGAIFGILALALLDVCYTWRERHSPVKDLAFLILDIVISFVIGLLPFVDNFAHIGGFVAGLASGLVLLHTPKAISRRLGNDDPPYTKASSSNRLNTSTGDVDLSGFRGFIKNPIGFFKGRKSTWWAWWLVRAGTLTMILVAVIVMLDSFYKKDEPCKWCRRLNCLPVKDWCEQDDLKGLELTPSGNTKRLMIRGVDLLKELMS